jgi:hypothetical protein
MVVGLMLLEETQGFWMVFSSQQNKHSRAIEEKELFPS